MRCKGCGIQLSANNIDNCPNCGTAEDQGKRDQLPTGFTGLLFNLNVLAAVGLGFAVLLGALVFLATQSFSIAIGVFLGGVACGGLAFLMFLYSDGAN